MDFRQGFHPGLVFRQFIPDISESGVPFPADADKGLAGGQFFYAMVNAGFQTIFRLSLVNGQKTAIPICFALSQPVGLAPGLLDRRFGMPERLGRAPFGLECIAPHVSAFFHLLANRDELCQERVHGRNLRLQAFLPRVRFDPLQKILDLSVQAPFRFFLLRSLKGRVPLLARHGFQAGDRLPENAPPSRQYRDPVLRPREKPRFVQPDAPWPLQVLCESRQADLPVPRVVPPEPEPGLPGAWLSPWIASALAFSVSTCVRASL